MRDTELKELIQEAHTSNYRVYGARKIWRELNRQGHAVARCTVERLMRELGIQGAVRGKRVITTIPGGQVERAPDLVDRNFVAVAPQRPWKALSQVELATAEWVDWYNHRRLHGEIGHVPPVEYEANHYMESTKHQVTTTI